MSYYGQIITPIYAGERYTSKTFELHYDHEHDMYFSPNMHVRIVKKTQTRNDDDYNRDEYDYEVECWVGQGHINKDGAINGEDKTDDSKWKSYSCYESLTSDDITEKLGSYELITIYKTKRILDIAICLQGGNHHVPLLSVYDIINQLVVGMPVSPRNLNFLKILIEDQGLSDEHFKKYMASVAAIGITDQMEIFLLYGGDVNWLYKGQNLLQWCFQSVTFWYDQNRYTQSSDSDSHQPTIRLILNGDMIPYLRSAGFDLNVLDQRNQNIFHWIVHSEESRFSYNYNNMYVYGDLRNRDETKEDTAALIGQLVELGVNINQKDICGLTPLDYAGQYDHSFMFTETLLKHGGTDSRHIDLADKICTRTTGCQISPDCFYRRPFQYIDFIAGRGGRGGRGHHDEDD